MCVAAPEQGKAAAQHSRTCTFKYNPAVHLSELRAVATKVKRNENIGKLQAGYLFPEVKRNCLFQHTIV